MVAKIKIKSFHAEVPCNQMCYSPRPSHTKKRSVSSSGDPHQVVKSWSIPEQLITFSRNSAYQVGTVKKWVNQIDELDRSIEWVKINQPNRILNLWVILTHWIDLSTKSPLPVSVVTKLDTKKNSFTFMGPTF